MESKDGILINETDSYPIELVRLLKSCEKDLIKFDKEEKRINNLQINIDEYLNPIENKYQQNWKLNINSIEEILLKEKFLGFHCTRLTNKEIKLISNNGLIPLSKELIKEKLTRVFSDKLISEETFKFLLENNASDQENRKGKIWFLHDTRTLKDSHSVGRLFENWGGESIYNDHENLQTIKSEITKIGKPTILVCSFDFEELSPFKRLAEYISKIWINRKSKESFVNLFDTKIVKEKEVKIIIKYGDKLFDELTEYRNWTIN